MKWYLKKLKKLLSDVLVAILMVIVVVVLLERIESIAVLIHCINSMCAS